MPDLKIPVAINTPLNDEPTLLSSAGAVHLADEPLLKEGSAIVDGNSLRKAHIKSPGLSPEDCLSQSKTWIKLLDLPRATRKGAPRRIYLGPRPLK